MAVSSNDKGAHVGNGDMGSVGEIVGWILLVCLMVMVVVISGRGGGGCWWLEI